jgi:hypothetical protein
MLTLEPFIHVNDGALEFSEGDGKAITLIDGEGEPGVEPPKYAAPAPADLERGVAGHNLARWLNATTPKGPVEDIPGDFISSKVGRYRWTLRNPS